MKAEEGVAVSPQELVREFHAKYGVACAEKPTIPDEATYSLRLRLIEEELREFEYATNIVSIADALGDLAYVVYGAALACGIDLQPVIEEIHRSNMTKNAPEKRSDGKIQKGEGWVPPDLARALREQGASLPACE